MDVDEKIYFTRKKIMQRILPITLKPELSIDNFINSDNQQLTKNLSSIQNNSNKNIYIYGNKSAGKTHILQSFTNFYLNKGLNAIYFNLNNDLTDFITILMGAEIIFLDNIEQSSTKNQQLIFDIYNHSNNFNIITSGSQNPQNLDIFIDLKTRISQSLSFKLNALNDDDKIKALTLRAKNKNIQIDSNIFKYLQKNYSRI